MDLSEREFEWDMAKEAVNVIKHGVDFSTAQLAFADPRRVIAEDLTHRQGEDRFYCLGRVGDRVLTVRFMVRGHKIRIIGAGFWRKGRTGYEQTTPIHE